MANLYNGERYIDPTAYQALTNIERKERSDRRKAKHKANREAKKLFKPEPIYRPVVYTIALSCISVHLTRPATSSRTLSKQENTAVSLSIRERSR